MENRFEMLVSDLCREIDSLHEEIETVTKDRDYYLKEFNSSLNRSIEHGNEMIGIALTSCLERMER